MSEAMTYFLLKMHMSPSMIDQWIEARARVKRDKDGEIYKQLKLTLLFIKKNQRHISLLIVRSHYYPIRQISFHSPCTRNHTDSNDDKA